MAKNLYEFNQFKSKQKNVISINENVQAVDDVYRVRKRIDIPMSLVNAFKKKVKDESGKNISQFYSDVELAEEMAEYIINSYVSIENLPVNLILGDQYSKSQGGSQSQYNDDMDDFDLQGQGGQPQGQGGQPQGQGGQPQGQGGQPQGQGGQPQGQGGQLQGQRAQRTASQIPPVQGGQI